MALAAGWPVRPGQLRERVRAAGGADRAAARARPPAGRLSVGAQAAARDREGAGGRRADPAARRADRGAGAGEADELLRVVGAFTARGGAAVLITHKLDEALAAADRVTVLRQGAVVLRRRRPTGQTRRERSAAAMIGRGDAAGESAERGSALARRRRLAAAARTRPARGPRGAARERLRHRGPAGDARDPRRRDRRRSPRSRGTASASCFARWPGGCTPLRGRLEVARPVGVHPRGPHHRRADPRADAHRERGARARARTIRGSGGGRLDWTAARARTAELLRSTASSRAGPGRAGRGAERRQPAEAGRRAGARARRRGSSWRRTRPAGWTSAPRGAIHARLRAAAARGRRRAGLLERPRRGARARPTGCWWWRRGMLLEPPPGRRAPRSARMMLGGADGDRWPLGHRRWSRRCSGSPCSPSASQLAGYDAGGRAWRRSGSGAFGSWYAFTSATLVRAVPLILIGLGIALAFRAGALNIGAEGQFYAGAIAATWVGLHVGGRARRGRDPRGAGSPRSLAGAAWVAVPVWLRLRFGVLEVISTLLLNFVAEVAGEPDGAGAAAGVAAHLSAERSDRRRPRACRSCPAPGCTRARCWRSWLLRRSVVRLRADLLGVPAARGGRGPARGARSAGGSTRAGWARWRCWCRARWPGSPAASR